MTRRAAAGRRRTAVLAALAAAVLLGVALRWGGEAWALLRDRPRLQAWLAGFGAWAPAVSVLLAAAKVIVAFLPGQVLALANGWLFGFGPGLLYSYGGVALGSGLALALARRWGRPLVARLVPAARLAHVDDLARRRGGPFFLLIFLLPLTPDDLTCFAVGLTRLPLLRMGALIALARLPGVAVAVWLGAHAAGLEPRGWALLGGACVAAVLAYLRWRESLEATVRAWLARASGDGQGS